MDGWPVWLASVTLREVNGRIRPTETWSAADFARASALLEEALEGLGDDGRERQFRMCSTLCRHRAVTDDEARRLPESWYTDDAVDIAGAPVELLWEKGIPPSLTSQPCRNPSWLQIDPHDPRDPRLKFPLDCGGCDTCRARQACEGRPMRRPVPCEGRDVRLEE